MKNVLTLIVASAIALSGSAFAQDKMDHKMAHKPMVSKKHHMAKHHVKRHSKKGHTAKSHMAKAHMAKMGDMKMDHKMDKKP